MHHGQPKHYTRMYAFCHSPVPVWGMHLSSLRFKVTSDDIFDALSKLRSAAGQKVDRIMCIFSDQALSPPHSSPQALKMFPAMTIENRDSFPSNLQTVYAYGVCVRVLISLHFLNPLPFLRHQHILPLPKLPKLLSIHIETVESSLS